MSISSTSDNLQLDTKSELKKVIILDLKIFSGLICFWLLFLLIAVFKNSGFLDILPILFFIGIVLTCFYYLFFTFILIIKFKQKFRIWYSLITLFIITPVLFFFSVVFGLNTSDNIIDKVVFLIPWTLLFIHYPMFHLISNLLFLKK
jgi:hypothetical protein